VKRRVEWNPAGSKRSAKDEMKIESIGTVSSKRMESQAIEAMTTTGQACRTADVGSGISVEAAISQVSISLHSITSAASASQSHFGKRFACVNARTPNGAGRRDCTQTLSACTDLGNKITEEVQ
jgi:hypothetical protein